jgi:hypothetical protein
MGCHAHRRTPASASLQLFEWVLQMANTAWGVISWVSVEMDVTEWKALLRNFRHSVTSIHGEPDEYGCHYGYTLWKANRADRADAVGMAWDWREMQPGVVGQDDPMSILTNVRLTRGGKLLSASEKILALNDAVYQIGWQRVARKHLNQRASELLRVAHADPRPRPGQGLPPHHHVTRTRLAGRQTTAAL